jgi:hypothetical protein
MIRAYLDANAWNYLVGNEMPRDLVERIRGALGEGLLRMIGAFPVLEEILTTHPRNPSKSTAMRRLAFDLVGRFWIREIIERVAFEVEGGARLDETSLYLPRDDRRRFERFSARDLETLEIADQLHDLGETFKAQEEEARRRVAERLGVAAGSAETRAGFREWFEQVDVREWCRDVLLPQQLDIVQSRGLELDIDTVPSLWLFVRFKMARIVLNVGEGRRIDASDLNDARHYASGAYFDVLVTDDRRFRETCNLITETPFEIWSLEQLTDADW